MTPANAIFATLLVPGSAHLVMGSRWRAAVVFVLTVGMFFTGYAILQDRLFHAVLFQPFSGLAAVFKVFPLNLLPEAPNIGCCIVANYLNAAPAPNDAGYDEAVRMMRLARPMEHFGYFLTGSSGIVACLVATDAHSLALEQGPRRLNRALAAGMSWLLPGSAHWLVGQKGKGLLLGGAVLAMFAIGIGFSAGAAVDRGQHDAYWITQSLFGGGTLIASLGLGQLEIPNPIPYYYSIGYTLTGIAGLMNLVVMIDAYTVVDESAARSVGTAAVIEAGSA